MLACNLMNEYHFFFHIIFREKMSVLNGQSRVFLCMLMFFIYLRHLEVGMQISTTKKAWVAKFGGTSVATYSAMVRCAKVIANYPAIRVVVVSAPAGVTNLLIKLSQINQQSVEFAPTLHEIKNKILAILSSLPEAASPQLREEVKQLLLDLEHQAIKLGEKLNRSLVDELLSYGERFSARLFASVLSEHGFKVTYLDARTLIKTNDCFGKAEVLIPETKNKVTQLLLPKCTDQIVVTEGFIGSTLQNITTTLGRGGSDYSAALLAEAMDAEVLQIWTDVPGIYTVDPALVSKAKPIDNMSFAEAAELATFGAKVLHPTTLWPAIRKNIPVFVGSSITTQTDGTWIRAAYPEDVFVPQLRAVALRRRQSLLTINSLEMLHTHGFLAKIFSVLAHHKLSVDLVTTSEVSVALTLDTSADNGELLTTSVLAELQAIGNVSLTIDKDLCLVALIGNRLHVTPGIGGRVFNALRQFNVRLICHGASSHNLCFLVNEQDAEAVVKIIHAEFFENKGR